MYFRIHHFHKHHVIDQSQKPWQHYPCQEARSLLQGHGEHTAMKKKTEMKKKINISISLG